MTEYDWHTVYTDAVKRFGGDTPGAALEQQILDAFTEQPQLVVRAIDRVAAKYAAGRVTSPWGAMKHEIQRATNQPHLHAVDSTDRNKSIIRAEQWIRAAGIHYDRDTEILLELFAPSGLLGSYATIELIPDDTDTGKWRLSEPTGDTALVDRIVKLYHDHRPTGITLEQDAHNRAEKFKQQKHELATALAQAHAAPPADHHDPDLPF